MPVRLRGAEVSNTSRMAVSAMAVGVTIKVAAIGDFQANDARIEVALEVGAPLAVEVVDDDDFVASGDQCIDEMAADEAGTAGNEDAHRWLGVVGAFEGGRAVGELVAEVGDRLFEAGFEGDPGLPAE